MITINLLREPLRPRVRWLYSGRSKSEVLGIGFLVITFLVMGGWYWSVAGQLNEKMVRRQALQQEHIELQGVLAEIDQFEKQRQQLEERIKIIEELKQSQKGPVVLMNGVISSIPKDPVLWLTSLSQDGESVSIEGRALTVPSIADFIGALDLRAAFENVELEYWEEDEDSIKFKISCQVRS